MEADFNVALKFFLANQMMIIVEENGLLDENYGLWKDQASTDTAIIKLLALGVPGQRRVQWGKSVMTARYALIKWKVHS